jgi:hypothetical protein
LRDLWERVVLDRGEILRTVFPREGTKMLKMPEEIIRDVLGPGANAERQEGEVVTIPLKLALDLVNQRRKREHKERYYETNRDKYLEYFRRYREENREKITQYQRQHYWANRERILERQRQYRKRNRETYGETPSHE